MLGVEARQLMHMDMERLRAAVCDPLGWGPRNHPPGKFTNHYFCCRPGASKRRLGRVSVQVKALLNNPNTYACDVTHMARTRA